MMIPVKVCGIMRFEDARQAVDLGASAVGFIFYPKSPRHIAVEQAQSIGKQINGHAKLVGVFVNQSAEEINSIARKCGLDLVQLSGHETPEIVSAIDVPVIKTIHMGAQFDPASAANYPARAFLLDTYAKGQFGGTGTPFDWDAVDGAAVPRPYILSGGLSPENVRLGIETLTPDAVDVNSGVELAPGVKDQRLMERFFANLPDDGQDYVPVF